MLSVNKTVFLKFGQKKMHFIITNAMHSGKMRAKTKTTEHIYERLFRKYGNLGWWPAETPEEVVIGAILTQNTSWTNVE
jgi:hypothetical protein